MPTKEFPIKNNATPASPIFTGDFSTFMTLLNQYSVIMENMDAGIIKSQVDSGGDGVIEYINNAALSMIGYTREQFDDELHGDISAIISCDDLKLVLNAARGLSLADSSAHFKVQGKRRDGKTITVSGTVICTNSGQGEKTGVFTFRNLSQPEFLSEQVNELSDFLSNIVDSIEIYNCDENLTITYVSNGFNKLTGYTKEDIIGSSSIEFHTKLTDNYNELWADASKQLKEVGHFCIEYPLRKNNGDIIHALHKGVIVGNDVDDQKIHCIISDISAQKKQEQLLTEKNFELEAIIDNLDAGIIRGEFNELFTITYANDGFHRMIGYTREQFRDEKNNSMGALVHPDDFAGMLAGLKVQQEKDSKTVYVNRLVRRDGTAIFILGNATVVENEDGTRVFLGIITDITAQKTVESALKLSENRHKIIMQNIGEGVFDYISGTKQIINYANSSERYKLPEIIEGGSETIIASGAIHTNSIENYRSLYAKIDAGDEIASAVIVTIDKDGKEITQEFVLINIFDDSGKPMRAVGLITNISETVALERERSFRRAMTAGQTLTYEVNVTQNQLISFDVTWAKSLGITKTTSFTELINYISNNIIHPDYKDAFFNFSSREEIEKEFNSGFSHIVMEYRKRTTYNSDKYIWAENRMNIISDPISRDIKLRCFVTDITRQKERESHLLEEQAFFDAISSNAMLVYDANITTNRMISGCEHWALLYGIKQSDSYTEMVNAFMAKAVYAEDQELFINAFNRSYILSQFEEDEREIYCEYRRPNEDGEFIWVACTLHLFEDPHTGEVRGRAYVENIDEDKKTELMLIYKSEHDLLTGIYNKSSTQELIEGFLATDEAKENKHGFFIIDIDHFKKMNDVFGHAFGDVVLSQLAGKFKELFREADIIGRVGGDEFVVLMKNVSTESNVEAKALEMCKYCTETYMQRGEPHRITLSVGIAIYSVQGTTYSALFDNADAALYMAKELGRNQYVLYNSDMTFHNTAEPVIDEHELVAAKKFDQNIGEYVFRILYEAEDKESAINTVLELLGKHYSLSRVYIFEKLPNGKELTNSYAWCEKGVATVSVTSQSIVYGEYDGYDKNFNSEGIYSLPYIEKAEPSLRKVLEQQNVKSMLQFSIMKNGKFIGLVGFDECKYVHISSQDEMSELRHISTILGVFITDMRTMKKAEELQAATLSIINGFNSYVYICNPQSYEILFINDVAHAIAPNAKIGDTCYKAFWNRKKPCDICPLIDIRGAAEPKVETEMHNTFLGVWVRTTATWIDWLDGKKACLVDSVDITTYKE